MEFVINSRIFKEFPGFSVAVIVAHNIDNTKISHDVINLFNELCEQIKRGLLPEKISQHPHIVSWRNAYTKFGAKPKKYLSSVENLVQRIVQCNTIESINTVVDLYNIISVKYLIPAGGEDFAAIQGNIELTFAGENEQAIYLLGEKEAREPKSGEVFYKDNQGAICRRWNWKEAERTKITKNTQDVFLVLEALPPVNQTLLRAAANELGFLIEKYCGGSVSIVFLDENHQSVELKNKNFITFNKPDCVSTEIFSSLSVSTEHQQNKEHISQEYEIRVEKVKKLRDAGIEPWPSAKKVEHTCDQVFKEFDMQSSNTYILAGRIMSIREHGKTIFAHIQDYTGKLQLYLKQDDLGKEQFSVFKEFIDIGDIIWITGIPFKTKMGEVTLHVSSYTLLSKCLHPLPEKFHGLVDVEIKYRQRYLDLIMNPDSKQKFIMRSFIIRKLRTFFDKHDFLEVETPMLHPIAGGATAKPFITHHNALNSDFYLRIAPELYLKRLVVGGFDRVYEINRNFRNEGISTRHNPEFTMVEFYMAHHEFHFIMSFVEDLFRSVVSNTLKNLQVPFAQHTIDFSLPFTRLSIKDAVITYTDINQKDCSPEHIDATLQKYNVTFVYPHASLGEKIFALFEKLVEPKLIQPTFIIDYPIEVSPLSKRDSYNPTLAARFELFIGGMEVSNGFNELNDPFDQAERFHQQLRAHQAGDEEAHQFDADYIVALEYGLVPTVGVGIGIDRMVMLLTNTTSIKDIILFPTLKKNSKN